MIDLYVFPPSPRAFKVMVIANHLGIETNIRPLDLIKGEQKTPEYAALNPNMRMPTLKDGDYVLWESSAIAQYLSGKKPDSGLFPKDERARLDVTRWQFWDVAHWDPACAVFLFENVVKPVVLKSGEPDPAALAKGGENFERAAKVLDAQLTGKKFIWWFLIGAGFKPALVRHSRCVTSPKRKLRPRPWPNVVLVPDPYEAFAPRNQALVCEHARIAGLAEDARAMRAARRSSGVKNSGEIDT